MESRLTQKMVNGLKPKDKKFDLNDITLRGLCCRVMPSGSATYYVRYWVSGKQKWYKLGDARAISLEQARTLAKKILSSVADGTDPQERKRAGRADHTLRTFIKHEFEPWALANRKAGYGTVQRIKTSFEKLLDLPLRDITAWQIEKLRAAWVKDTGNRNAGDRDIACLKAMFTHAIEWGHLQENPVKTVKLRKADPAGKIRIMTPKEETNLWAALDARESRIRAGRRSHNLWCWERHLQEWPDLDRVAYADFLKPMLTVLLYTGMRRGETFNLQWRDVDVDKRTLTVRGETAKSGKTRMIPLNAVALDTLKAWRAQSPKENDLVFPSPKTGERFDNISTTWAKIIAEAGIKNLRTHDLRHTFASRCLAAGADINCVRELLGHSDIKTTAIYLHSSAQDKAAAVARLTPPSNVIAFAGKQEEGTGA